MKIIDVSHHNGNIDWQTVKGNVDGVILHCGYGQDLEKQDDPRFREWATECTILGIPFGVYLYSYAKSVDRIEGEAKHTLRLIKGYNLSLPVFFDSEEPGTESVAQACALKYMEIIKAAGYAVGIYASESWYKSYMSGIKDCPLWIAKYGINDCLLYTSPSPRD